MVMKKVPSKEQLRALYRYRKAKKRFLIYFAIYGAFVLLTVKFVRVHSGFGPVVQFFDRALAFLRNSILLIPLVGYLLAIVFGSLVGINIGPKAK